MMDDRKNYLNEQASLRPTKRDRISPMEREKNERNKDFEEVSLGFTEEEAVLEAERCLNCKNPTCISGCPVEINIPKFIMAIRGGNIKGAKEVIDNSHAFPGITGRVCPQETQCESVCVLEKVGKPVNIGKLERYVGDFMRKQNENSRKNSEKKFEHSVGIVGSGPSAMSLSYDLLKAGIKPIIYEAFDKLGGVLTYGIPSFRLPREVIGYEIEELKNEGLEVKLGTIVGKSISIDELLKKHDFVFLGSGAGLPRLPEIPGTDSNNVFTANEFLTRINLCHANLDGYKTPLPKGETVAVIGGGNVAMDAARSAKRLYKSSEIFYRRGEEKLSARIEEIEHAKEEGVVINTNYNPVSVNEDEITFMVNGEEVKRKFDIIIFAIGTEPNKLMNFEKEGIKTVNGLVEIDEYFETSRDRVYAGGDVVSGAATVIRAMESGKIVARNIIKRIGE